MRGPFLAVPAGGRGGRYGSLYRSTFSDTPKHGILGDLPRFAEVAAAPRRHHRQPKSCNLPIGLFWALAFPSRGPAIRVLLGTLVGAAMSVSVEIAQIYDATRTPASTTSP